MPVMQVLVAIGLIGLGMSLFAREFVDLFESPLDA
jgi:hypothetical protein